MRTLNQFAALVVGLASASGAFAQSVVWKYVQPWTPRLAAHTSRVQSCQNPAPLPQIALDDWVCGATGPIIRIEWWGTLSDPAQAKRPFYIAIYSSLATVCQPNLQQPLYQTCVIPDYCRQKGTDCQNRPVYLLSAPLPTTWSQVQGTHYWLQISEDDQDSIHIGAEDFRWSSHRQIMNCAAISAFPVTQPIFDACDQQPDDLAFGLGSRYVTVLVPPGVLTATLRVIEPTSGDMLEEIAIEPDPDGTAIAAPDLPDGTYELDLYIGGALRQRKMATLQNGGGTTMSFFDVFYGDLNFDNAVGLPDLAILLSNYGKMGP